MKIKLGRPVGRNFSAYLVYQSESLSRRLHQYNLNSFCEAIFDTYINALFSICWKLDNGLISPFFC